MSLLALLRDGRSATRVARALTHPTSYAVRPGPTELKWALANFLSLLLLSLLMFLLQAPVTLDQAGGSVLRE